MPKPIPIACFCAIMFLALMVSFTHSSDLNRKELEKVLDTKVMLKTWVKVKSGWSDNESLLPSMGYDLDK